MRKVEEESIFSLLGMHDLLVLKYKIKLLFSNTKSVQFMQGQVARVVQALVNGLRFSMPSCSYSQIMDPGNFKI